VFLSPLLKGFPTLWVVFPELGMILECLIQLRPCLPHRFQVDGLLRHPASPLSVFCITVIQNTLGDNHIQHGRRGEDRPCAAVEAAGRQSCRNLLTGEPSAMEGTGHRHHGLLARMVFEVHAVWAFR
jgi:hypothetical protein